MSVEEGSSPLTRSNIMDVMVSFCLLNVYLPDHIKGGLPSVLKKDQKSIVDVVNKGFKGIFGESFLSCLVPIQELLLQRARIISKAPSRTDQTTLENLSLVDDRIQAMRDHLLHFFMALQLANRKSVINDVFPYEMTNGMISLIRFINKMSFMYTIKPEGHLLENRECECPSDQNMATLLSEIEISNNVFEQSSEFAKCLSSYCFKPMSCLEPCKQVWLPGTFKKRLDGVNDQLSIHQNHGDGHSPPHTSNFSMTKIESDFDLTMDEIHKNSAVASPPKGKIHPKIGANASSPPPPLQSTKGNLDYFPAPSENTPMREFGRSFATTGKPNESLPLSTQRSEEFNSFGIRRRGGSGDNSSTQIAKPLQKYSFPSPPITNDALPTEKLLGSHVNDYEIEDSRDVIDICEGITVEITPMGSMLNEISQGDGFVCKTINSKTKAVLCPLGTCFIVLDGGVYQRMGIYVNGFEEIHTIPLREKVDVSITDGPQIISTFDEKTGIKSKLSVQVGGNDKSGDLYITKMFITTP